MKPAFSVISFTAVAGAAQGLVVTLAVSVLTGVPVSARFISAALACALVMLGDDVTTDHIAPVGSTSPESQVGRYLIAHGVAPADFNSLSSRRAHPEVVARTAYANVRLRNEIVPEREGDVTRHSPAARSCRSSRRPRATGPRA